jgi:hypothetical protein
VKLTAHGVVQGVRSRRRLLFFKDRFLMIRMEPEDIKRIEAQVNARFPGYGSLGSKGCAVPFEQLGRPESFVAGQHVEMTVNIGNATDQHFLGVPPLSLDAIRPLPAA